MNYSAVRNTDSMFMFMLLKADFANSFRSFPMRKKSEKFNADEKKTLTLKYSIIVRSEILPCL